MTDSNLFKEIQEDLEREKMEALWKKYGPIILAGAVVLVITAGGISGWSSWKNARNVASTDAWHQALSATKGQDDSTIAALEEFTQSHAGSDQAALAGLQAAALLAKRGETSRALAAYDALAAQTSPAPVLRQLAILNAVRLEADRGDPSALLNKLQPLLVEGAAWRPAATELAGHLALAAGDPTKARQYFSVVAQDATAPLDMSKRANSMLRYLSDTAPAAASER